MGPVPDIPGSITVFAIQIVIDVSEERAYRRLSSAVFMCSLTESSVKYD